MRRSNTRGTHARAAHARSTRSQRIRRMRANATASASLRVFRHITDLNVVYRRRLTQSINAYVCKKHTRTVNNLYGQWP